MVKHGYLAHRARSVAPGALTMAVLLAAGVLAIPAGAQQGYEPMRQVARELGHPGMMLVFDRSGSTGWTAIFQDQFDAWRELDNHTGQFWAFEFALEHRANVATDFSLNRGSLTHNGGYWVNTYPCSSCSYYPSRGAGNGYWVRAGDFPATIEESSISLEVGFADGVRTEIYYRGNENLSRNDIIRISSWPADPGQSVDPAWENCTNNGLFKILTNPARQGSGTYTGWNKIQVAKIDSAGNFGAAAFSFQGATITPTSRNRARARKVTHLSSDKASYWYFVPASRMAIQKNVLGPHLPIFEPNPETAGSATPDVCGKEYYTFPVGGGPRGGAYYNWPTKAWVGWSDTAQAPAGDPAYTLTFQPADVVGRSRGLVNWGLITYSGTATTTHQAVVADEANQDPSIAVIHDVLRGVAAGGISSRGGTPTRGALAAARDSLIVTAAGDDKRTCRTWATLLVTDGESNTGNPSDGTWGETCPAEWSLYPPGRAEELWNAVSSGYRLNIRTFAVGVSPEVSRCELNYTAYRGRTDASSPLGDGGFDLQLNPRMLPRDYSPATGDYAFFANNVEEFRTALEGVLGSLGIGDYNTAPPAVTSGLAGTGSLGFVTSSGFPGFKGHLYAYDLRADCTNASGAGIIWDCTKPCGWVGTVGTREARSNCVWDGGQVLAEGNRDRDREIFTWVPPATADGQPQLLKVENTAAVRTALRTLGRRAAGCTAANELTLTCSFNALLDSGDLDADADGDVLEDAEVERWLDFVLGNDGTATDTRRAWPLGALVYTTPAVTGPPLLWKKQRFTGHAAFESDYQARHRLVWVGSSSGMVHAFDTLDGAEILALLPPGMLSQQARLYNRYLQDGLQYPTGQPRDPMSHDYGVANSMRFGDIWVAAENRYRTVLLVAEGKGGRGVHGIDITNPYPGRTVTEPPDPEYPDDPPLEITYPPDYNYDAQAPVRPLWSRWGHANFGLHTQLTGLGQTWSIPAMGGYWTKGNPNIETWGMNIGSGFTNAAALDSNFWLLNPATGAVRQTLATGRVASGTRVNVQSFADSVLWSTTDRGFAADNYVDQMVQADLHGRIHFVEHSLNQGWGSRVVGFSVSGQPIYYSPAVGISLWQSNPVKAWNYYAFATGTFFEVASSVTGVNVGTSGNFIPTLYIGARRVESDADGERPTYGDSLLQSVPIKNVPKFDDDGAPIPGSSLGIRSQVTSSPMILMPRIPTAGDPQALFLVYDPDGEQCGASYIVRLTFKGTGTRKQDEALNILSSGAYTIGAGIMGGFALVDMGDHYAVVASRSYRGSGGRANLVVVPNLRIEKGRSDTPINWWRELL